MRIRITLIFVFTLLSAGTSLAQNPKVLAVLTYADWCRPCLENGPRVEQDVIYPFLEKDVLLILNDRSNDQKRKQSTMLLDLLGINDKIGSKAKMARIILFDTKTKEIIGEIGLSSPSNAIENLFAEALKKAS